MIKVNELRRLTFSLAKRLEGQIHGDVLGTRHGQGSEIGDARLYIHGDDVRRIDWALLARTGETYVRDVIADREITSAILVDLTGSMTTGTRGHTRAQMALEAAVAFGYVVGRGPNKVGFLGMAGVQERWWKPQQGQAHLLAAVHQLGTWKAEPTDGPHRSLGEGIRRLHQLHHRRGVAAVVSDFTDQDWVRPLQALAHTHETVCIRIVDPIDLNLPNVGVIRLEDPETGQQMQLDTSSYQARRLYERKAHDRQARIHEQIVQTGALDWVITTDQDPVDQMVHHLLDRQRMVKALHGVPVRKVS